ncbi:Hypothetical protein A7982_11318 [Minicystis rosea]|nr:Hypothetical protein A7982_11318 [Minicystis rosea]
MEALLAQAPSPPWTPLAGDIHSRAGVPIHLEPLGVQHAAAYGPLFRADPRLPELVWLPPLRTRRATESWIRRGAREGGWEPFAIIHRELGLVGAISLVFHGSIGAFWFWIGAEHRQRGFGAQALALLQRLATEHHRLEGLVALVLAVNTPSRHVLRARGFRETGLTVLPRREGVLLYASDALREAPSLPTRVGDLLASVDASVRIGARGRKSSLDTRPSPRPEGAQS